MHGETTRGLRRREREQMRTRLGYCHFHMIKQLAIWDASNKVVQPDRSGCLEHNPSLAPSLTLLNSFPHLCVCVCVCLPFSRILQPINAFTARLRLPSVWLTCSVNVQTHTHTQPCLFKQKLTSLSVMWEAAGSVDASASWELSQKAGVNQHLSFFFSFFNSICFKCVS